MPVRLKTRVCKECGECVVIAQLADQATLWQIKLAKSVTDASALADGMGASDFYGAQVVHRAIDGKVKHSIVAPRELFLPEEAGAAR